MIVNGAKVMTADELRSRLCDRIEALNGRLKWFDKATPSVVVSTAKVELKAAEIRLAKLDELTGRNAK